MAHIFVSYSRRNKTAVDALIADLHQAGHTTWFDKPADLAQARQSLLALRGRTHDLVTPSSVHSTEVHSTKVYSAEVHSGEARTARGSCGTVSPPVPLVRLSQ